MEGYHEQHPYFRGFALQKAVFPILTSSKATLFTAIVTAFVLDALPDLEKIPPSKPPSSIRTVCSLWFLSITSSLAATTWAILCLEWCASLTEGVEAEDYQEMAGKIHQKFEAMEGWKMRFIVAGIPLSLHVSLFLFLAGFWLRLRDIDEQFGLIVGVPSLIIALSYVVVTLLPTFTNAPFLTSVSEIIQPLVNGIGYIIKFPRFARLPLPLTWISSILPVLLPTARLLATLRSLVHRFTNWARRAKTVKPHSFPTLRSWVHRFTNWARRAYKSVKPYLDLFFPKVVSDANPFDEVNRLQIGPSKLDRKIYLRALLWLMKTPLSRDDVKEILVEFKNRGGTGGEPLDHTTTRLLVLSLPSVLDDENWPQVFDYCTEALAAEMERAFTSEGHNQGAIFRRSAIREKLLPHFRLVFPENDGSQSRTTCPVGDYWQRAIQALWICPSKETIREVVAQLDPTTCLIETPILLRIIRGLHAATLVCFDEPPLKEIPDFSLWSWCPSLSDPDLDTALSSFLQALFASLYTTLDRSSNPVTIPSLVTHCLREPDDNWERYPLRLHTALSFFVAVVWRSDPCAFGNGSLVADALLLSAEFHMKKDGDDPRRSKVLVTRLYGIAYGPKPLIPGQIRSLTRLRNLSTGHPKSTDDGQLFTMFLDAYAATLEATLATDGRFTMLVWLSSPDSGAARTIHTDPLFAGDSSIQFVLKYPKCRLPYLYSLAIALTYTAEERNQEFWRVADLFVTREEKERDKITPNRALDTNILVVAVLKFVVLNQPEMRPGPREGLIGRLENIVLEGTNWRTHWKSIYLAASLAFLLSQMDVQSVVPQFLIDKANEAFEQVKHEQVPSDWRRKRKGLKLCNLKAEVKSLANTAGEKNEEVYEWSSQENVPCLALYNPRRNTLAGPGHLALKAFHRYVRFFEKKEILIPPSQVCSTR